MAAVRCGLAALLVTLVAAVQAATPDPVAFRRSLPASRPPYSATHFPNWSGVWAKQPSPDIPFEDDTKGVGTRQPSPIDYQPEYAARYKAFQDQVIQGVPVYIPATLCLPPGMPYMLYTLYPMQVMMTPGMVTMITEYGGSFRNIYTDGRGLPDDMSPSFTGYSVGHWEGDTLVVTTKGLRGDTTIDGNGLPHSDALTLTERYREVKPGEMEVRVTMDDPKAFRKPYTRVTHWKYQPDWVINEYVCLENNRNPVDASGKTLLVMPTGTK